MSGLATKRIQNELAAMQNDPPPGCVLGEMGDDIFRLEQSPPFIILLPGPQKTTTTKDKSCGIKRKVLKVEIYIILIGAQVLQMLYVLFVSGTFCSIIVLLHVS